MRFTWQQGNAKIHLDLVSSKARNNSCQRLALSSDYQFNRVEESQTQVAGQRRCCEIYKYGNYERTIGTFFLLRSQLQRT